MRDTAAGLAERREETWYDFLYKHNVFDGKPMESVLNVGIGYSTLFSGSCMDVYGIDIHEDVAEFQRDKVFIKDMRLCDVSDSFPKYKTKFPLAVATEVLEHLYDGRVLLRNIRNVLSPGGYLFLTIPNDFGFYMNRLNVLFKGLRGHNAVLENPYDYPHVRFFNEALIGSLLTSEGYDVIAIEGYNPTERDSIGGWLRAPPFKDALAKAFPDLFATNYMILARKVTL